MIILEGGVRGWGGGGGSCSPHSIGGSDKAIRRGLRIENCDVRDSVMGKFVRMERKKTEHIQKVETNPGFFLNWTMQNNTRIFGTDAFESATNSYSTMTVKALNGSRKLSWFCMNIFLSQQIGLNVFQMKFVVNSRSPVVGYHEC